MDRFRHGRHVSISVEIFILNGKLPLSVGMVRSINDGGFGHDGDDVIFKPDKPRRVPNDNSVS